MGTDRIAANISNVRRRVSASAEKYQRGADSITIIAVSKTQPVDAVRSAHAAGMRDFGENYLQEALDKIRDTQNLDLVWHFIGPIQSNKTRPIAEHFSWVHSVERLKIAQRLSAQRPASLPPLNICLQVNVSGEQSKAGIAPTEVAELAAAVIVLPRLRLRGLMAIPAATDNPAEQRSAFASLAALLPAVAALAPDADTLSMGMSADLESAIAEGATMVRIGTDIFGRRGG